MHLNQEQQRVVESDSRAIMVIAVAGSGKTTTLTERIRRLLGNGVSPYEILVITFTRKAAGILREKLATFVHEDDLRKMYIGTSHSFCCRVIRDFGELIGYSRNFTIYDEIDRADILEAIVEDYRFKLKARDLEQKISRDAKSEFEGDEAAVWAEYCARLKRNNALDYDLILDKAVEIIRNYPEALRHYRNRFKHILYDELQDVSKLEDQMLLTLAIENSLVVGDYSQNIYGFRGCSNQYVLAYRERHPDCEIIKLPRNYRTVPEICQAAERLINHNPQPFGRYQLIPARFDNPWGPSIEVIADLRDEETHVAFKIAERVKSGSSSPRDWAVLVRTNAQIETLKVSLEQAGVPVQVVKRDSYWSREPVRNALAYLRVIANRRDDHSMRRILRLPHLNISPVRMREIQLEAVRTGESLWRICQDLVPETSPNSAVVVELVAEFVEESSYRRWLLDQGLKTKAGWIDELMERVSEWQDEVEDYDYSLDAFLESISLESAVDSYDEDREAVSLMTLHCAKGLEWPNVWIAGCEEGLIPLRSGELEEERRLFFVGVTRARDRLYLSSAGERQKWGKVLTCRPSRFLLEMEQ